MVDRDYWYDTINSKVAPMQMPAAEALYQLEYLNNLDVASRAAIYRLTGIMGTIGPSCNTAEKIYDLIVAGLTVARINLAYTNPEQFSAFVKEIRKAEEMYNEFIKWTHPICIVADLRGPEMRTGKIDPDVGETIELVTGEKIKLTVDRTYMERCSTFSIYVDYDNIVKVVRPGHQIFCQFGNICFQCVRVVGTTINCIIKNGGVMESKSRIFLPGINIDLPNLSEQDRIDAIMGAEEGVDVIVLSYVRQPSAIVDMKRLLLTRKGGKNIKVYAKIESQQGLNNMDEIIKAADGVLISRGRIAIEIPREKIFLAQKRIIARCNVQGKPVVCGKQMLTTMVRLPRPTRAETSDIANIVLDGADCIMLSEETAVGKYAVACVTMVSGLCQEAESCTWQKRSFEDLLNKAPTPADIPTGLAISAVQCVLKCRAAAIIVVSLSGRTAQMISKFRPRCPIIVVTKTPQVARQCRMCRGVFPVLHTEQKKSDWWKVMDIKAKCGIMQGIKMGYISKSDCVVIITGWKHGQGYTNTMRVASVTDYLEHLQ